MSLHWRNIVVDGVKWKWRVGLMNVVLREDNTKLVVSFSKLTGKTWNDIERGEWKLYFHITPGEVAEYIRSLA